MNLLSAIGGRKFAFALLVTVLAFGLVIAGKATTDEWLKFVAVVGITYVVGNVTNKAVTK